ncbi:uncharacterized protein LOC110836211 isoform X2 [Zootermopsis nevadensis]|uniref:uncharacterized protein LOC110836211 isoform X2 n=1 Tax=Zootermopsis nevadensis TaxID=136037 RepID=UPI000B8E4CA4|nr:uncharacterized protein LOC110836211 isoform X2 [Zootermopsis nevadensis]
MAHEVTSNSLPERETLTNEILLAALKQKLKDPTIPRLTWQLPSHHSESESEDSECNSDSSATFCSDFEKGNDKGHKALILMSRGNNPPENQEAINKQDKIQAIMGASSMTETDRMQVKDGQMMIYNAMGKNNDNSISMEDAKCPCPSSPVIHEINTNWSHLIEPIFSNDDTNTTFLTTAGTENNENICVNTSSEPVALTNLTYKNPISDVTSVSNVQVNPMEIQSDSMMSKAASAAMSADIFANLSPAMEHGGSDCKTSPNDFEQDGVINKNMQLSIEDEIIEIGKSFSHTLNIVSTDSTSESSPDNILPHCKNNHKYKNKGQNKVYNKYEGERFKSQFLLPDTTGNIQDGESKTKAIRAKEFDSHARRNRRGNFPKAREFHNRCQKNNNQDNHKSERTEERIHRFRKETERKKHKICPSVGRRITRMQTGSLPTPLSSTHRKTFSRRPHSMNTKYRIRDRMSDIQQEVRAWLQGWGPSVDKARAHKLIAEVQETHKKVLSSSQSNDCGNLKQYEVEEFSQVSEKLVSQLQSALMESDTQEQGTTNLTLECHACCSECSNTESDANIEMYGQGGNYSEIIGLKNASMVPLQRIQQRELTQEMALPDDDETVREHPASVRSNSEKFSSESLEIANSKDSASHCLWKHSGTSLEATCSNLHNLLCSYERTPEIRDSLETMNHGEQEQIKSMLSRRDPRLRSASYANLLFGTKTSLTNYTCETDTQSTYFSSDPRSSKQTEIVSHATDLAKFTVQMNKPADSTSVNINSNNTNHTQSAHTSNNQSISAIRQNKKGSNINSKQGKSNSEYTASVNENINELPKNSYSQSILNLTKTSDLPHLSGSKCTYSSGTSKEQATNLSATSGEKLIMNFQSRENPPDEHRNQNVRETESSTFMKNYDETIAANINIKKRTETPHSSIKTKTKHRVESRTKLMSNENSQPEENVTQPSVKSRKEKQMENLQQLLCERQQFTAESHSSDNAGPTQNLLTQSEELSFIFGIKKIWSHSASEFIPNYQLPEGFWTDNATPVPNDLLQAAENW